jgi:hypothetical protein
MPFFVIEIRSVALRDWTFSIESAFKAIWTETHNQAGGWLFYQAKSYGHRSRDLVKTLCRFGSYSRQVIQPFKRRCDSRL